MKKILKILIVFLITFLISFNEDSYAVRNYDDIAEASYNATNDYNGEGSAKSGGEITGVNWQTQFHYDNSEAGTSTLYVVTIDGVNYGVVLDQGDKLTDTVKGYNTSTTSDVNVPDGNVIRGEEDVAAVLRAAGQDELADKVLNNEIRICNECRTSFKCRVPG